MKLNKEIDQWPKCSKLKINRKLSKRKEKIVNIENFFKKKYQTKYAFLMPSSRSSIALILRYLKINRSNTVSISKWNSHCMFASIGAFSNIEISNSKSDVIIVNHKWGNEYLLNKKIKKNSFVIEDSADTIPTNKFKPFINKGIAELISLPKIIGSICGGLVLTNNKRLFKFGKKFQNKNKNLGIIQTKKKIQQIKKNLNQYDDWYYYEAWNTYVDANLINDVILKISNFNKNKTIIEKRRNILSKFFNIKFCEKRLGPLGIIKFTKGFKINTLIKHFNFEKNVFLEKYKKSIIIPLHFGISDKLFDEITNRVRK